MGGSSGDRVEVLLLGPVCVRTGGREVALGSARQRAVLARLALEPGVVVSVDVLVETLWGDDPPANARGNLQSHVSRLRSAIGEDALTFQYGGYRLDVPADAVDAHRAEVLSGQARELRQAGATADAAQRFADALALWRGPSLGDLADDIGLGADAVRLDELRDRLVDELLEVRLEGGEAAGVLPEIRRRAANAPLRERSQLLLVRALHECGRSVDALRAAERYRQVLAEETGLDPGPDLGALERRILNGDPPEPSSSAVPPPPAPRPPRRPRTGTFVGRDGELARLAELCAEEGLVTVTGPGGVGKTRLVTELLGSRTPPVAVHVVELDAAEPDEVVPGMARSTGARIGYDLRALVDHLALRPCMVVLDGCEQVLVEVRRVVNAVLRDAPDVQLLATSRVRLGVPGEAVLPLAPLPSADPASPALHLLRDRIGAQDPGLPLDDVDALAEVCRRLDGIPLALELAAARIAALGIDAVVARLDRALDLLGAAVGVTSDRHADLRRVVQWSLDQVSPQAVEVLEVCAAFDRGFPLAAVEVVAAAVTDAPVPVCVAELTDASLLLPTDRFGVRRYRMLETVRALALERLEQSGRATLVRQRHADWAGGLLAEQVHRARGPAERDAVVRLELERGNIRGALRLVASAGDVDAAAAFARSLADLVLYRPDGETLRWLRELAAMDGAPGSLAEPVLCGAAARAAYLLGDLPACRDLAEHALALDPDAPAEHARHSLGVWHLYRGEHERAIDCWQEITESPHAPPADRIDARGGIALAAAYAGDLTRAAVEAARLSEEAAALDHPTSIAWARYVWGEVELCRDGERSDAARAAFEASASLAGELGADFVSGVAGVALLSLATRVGDGVAVRRHGVEILELLVRMGTWPQVWTAMRLVAEHLAACGLLRDAVLVLDAADRDPAAPVVVGEDARRHTRIRTAAEGTAPLRPALDPVSATSPRAVVVRHVIGVLRRLDGSA